MRYFGMADMRRIERMTLDEYELRSQAYALARVDRTQEAYITAFANRNAQAVDEDGHYIYAEIKDVFNIKDAEQKILHPQHEEPMNSELVKIARRLQAYRQRKGGE